MVMTYFPPCGLRERFAPIVTRTKITADPHFVLLLNPGFTQTQCGTRAGRVREMLSSTFEGLAFYTSIKMLSREKFQNDENYLVSSFQDE
jgi:hypothetical protein